MKKILFLDTETTGRTDKDRLIQLAMQCPAEEWSYNMFFKPPLPITFEAMAVHHITNDMIGKSEPMDDTARATIQNMLDGHVVVAHNAQFDIEMLMREGLTVGESIDTLKIAQYLFDEPMYKLQYLRYRFDLKIDGKAHDAEGDVAVLEALFHYLRDIVDMQSDEVAYQWMIEISKQPGLIRRMPFGKHKGVKMAEVDPEYLQWLLRQKDIDSDLRFTCEQILKPKTVPTPPTSGQQLINS